LAKKILDNWANYVTEFIKVTPIEYKKVLEEERIEAIKKKIANVEFDY
jgi:glutamate synthase (NADPH/NADH) large chain